MTRTEPKKQAALAAAQPSGAKAGAQRKRQTPSKLETPPKLEVPSKLTQLEALLGRKEGASIAEMMEATGWQAHSVRGAMAGALKKRGFVIKSDKIDDIRRYRAERSS